MTLRTVAALYVDMRRGPYPSMTSVDCWDVSRDAKLYEGPHPVVAHPPCGPWSKLSHLCTKQDPECGVRAVEQVLEFGGVLEHPAHSKLWSHMNLPRPGEFHVPHVFTLEVDQCRWGHQARKHTWLLCSRVDRSRIGALPLWREPTHVIDSSKASKRAGTDVGKHIPKSRRHLTPPEFAQFLVRLARSVQ